MRRSVLMLACWLMASASLVAQPLTVTPTTLTFAKVEGAPNPPPQSLQIGAGAAQIWTVLDSLPWADSVNPGGCSFVTSPSGAGWRCTGAKSVTFRPSGGMSSLPIGIHTNSTVRVITAGEPDLVIPASVSVTSSVPPPVDCVVSAWSAWIVSEPWHLVGTELQRTLERARTILTTPANGGALCPALVETQVETKPFSIASCVASMAEVPIEPDAWYPICDPPLVALPTTPNIVTVVGDVVAVEMAPLITWLVNGLGAFPLPIPVQVFGMPRAVQVGDGLSIVFTFREPQE